MRHLSGDLSKLAVEAGDLQLADAIIESEEGFESIADIALSFADIDLTGIYGHLDAKLRGNDIAKALHSFREQSEDFLQLADDFSDLAVTTEDDELVDAIYENEYVYSKTGEDLLYAAEIDASDLDRDEYGDIDQTCGTNFR